MYLSAQLYKVTNDVVIGKLMGLLDVVLGKITLMHKHSCLVERHNKNISVGDSFYE